MRINPALLTLPQESTLYAACLLGSSQLSESANVNDFLAAFETMTPAVTAFFDHVLVHTDDMTLRDNRIALLQLVSGMQDGLVDMSELENF